MGGGLGAVAFSVNAIAKGLPQKPFLCFEDDVGLQ
jgi:hypothetical protein